MDNQIDPDEISQIQVVLAMGDPEYSARSKIITDRNEIESMVNAFNAATIGDEVVAPTALITNAVIVAPMVTRKKLDPASRKSLTKFLTVLSLLLFVIVMITLHVIAPFDWGHVAVWSFNTMASIVFVAVCCILKISDKIRNTGHFSNYVLPFFTIGLIIWSFFIGLSTILS